MGEQMLSRLSRGADDHGVLHGPHKAVLAFIDKSCRIQWRVTKIKGVLIGLGLFMPGHGVIVA